MYLENTIVYIWLIPLVMQIIVPLLISAYNAGRWLFGQILGQKTRDAEPMAELGHAA